MKVVVIFSLYHAKAQRRSKGIKICSFLNLGCVVDAPRLLYLREKEPVTIALEGGYALGPVLTGTENLTSTWV